jgi:hypothetical protein
MWWYPKNNKDFVIFQKGAFIAEKIKEKQKQTILFL